MFASMTFVHSLAWNYANAGDANDFVHANNHEGPISRKVSSFSSAESCFMFIVFAFRSKFQKFLK